MSEIYTTELLRFLEYYPTERSLASEWDEILGTTIVNGVNLLHNKPSMTYCRSQGINS